MKPEKTKNGLTFYPIPEFSDVDAAFGADSSAYFKRDNLPDVPREYEDMASALMFKGGKLISLSPKVNQAEAMKAVRAWLCSFEPSHEAKISTVAYALWLWSSEDSLS